MKYKDNSNYNKWSDWLIKNGFENLCDKSVFIQNIEKITFNSTCPFHEKFIRERYFMFFNDSEILKISKTIKEKIYSKRPSMYDPVALSIKLGITIEESNNIVKERKSKTSGTLDNFIKRHGEEIGKQKYFEFCQKSSHTKKKYIEKYGEIEGDKKWNSYIKTKGLNKDEYLKKYGGVEGEILWENLNKKKSYGSSKSGIQDKYGKDYYDSMIRSRNYKNSLLYYIEKYGENDGKNRWENYTKKKDSCSFNAILKKYDGNFLLAEAAYKNNIMKISPIYSKLKELYGEEVAVEKYKSKVNFNLTLPIHTTKPHLKSKNGCVSKSSNLFFEDLKKETGKNLIFGNKKTELKLFNEEFLEFYYYDCFDESSNTIIEFNGVTFHPKENQLDFVNVGNKKQYEESFTKDQRKINFAKSLGYNVYVVWSDEIHRKHERLNKLIYLKNELQQNESKKNN